MSNIFFISDTHFGHRGVCRFTTLNGKLRPWDTTEEMDAALIDNWNKVVKPCDTVIHLGDVCLNRSAISTIGRCNGKKQLVKGNHDVFRLEEYSPYFEDIHGCKTYNARFGDVINGVPTGFICTHIPLHPDSVKERWRFNVHGHTHAHNMYKDNKKDPLYFCVSVEQINYTPIALEELVARLKAV